MSLRSLFVLLAVFSSLPFILRNPYVGVLMWEWLGFMNPHRLTGDSRRTFRSHRLWPLPPCLRWPSQRSPRGFRGLR